MADAEDDIPEPRTPPAHIRNRARTVAAAAAAAAAAADEAPATTDQSSLTAGATTEELWAKARAAAARAVPGNYPAVAVAVAAVAGGNIVQSFGFRNAAPHADTDAERLVFFLASITKTVVAVVALQAAERGELDLDADINDHLQAVCRVSNPHFPSAAITPRQLLTHTGSLRDDESALEPGPWRVADADCEVTPLQYVESRLVPGGARFAPRVWSSADPPGTTTRYHYSNAGFTLLAAVLERATGKTLPVLARDGVFAPLGMDRTSFSLRDARAVPDATLLLPHRRDGTAIGHYGVAEWPASQVRSTAVDLARFLVAMAAPPGQCPILSGRSVAQLLPASSEQGLAWWGTDATYGEGCKGVWAHGGFMAGARTHIYLFPAHGAGYVVLTNGEGPYAEVASATEAALQHHVGVSLRQLAHGSMGPTTTDAVDPAGVAAMRLAVGPHDDCYQWCQEEGMYCSQDKLLGWMDSEEPNSPLVLVVDTRDDDVAGGMIRGAIHAADRTFEDVGLATVLHRVSELLEKTQDAATSSSKVAKVAVVFHCMESARRGPRCARRTHVYLRAAAAAAAEASPPVDAALWLSRQSISLHVLQGGADQWIRRFFRDPSRTQGFDDDYWGFLVSGDEEDNENGSCKGGASGDGGAPASSDSPQHRLYHRPADQPATPWSAAGSNIASVFDNTALEGL